MGESGLQIQKDGAIGWLTFSNPAKLNAMTFAMWQGLPAAIAAFEADPAIRVVVLRGAGTKAFVSGADISEFEEKRGTADAVEAYNAAGDAASAAIEACGKPTLAMIHGYCIGGGLGLALTCDLRFADEDASFAIPAAKLGLGYRYDGIERLVRVVGPSHAKDILYSARRLPVAEARAMGLVNAVLPATELEREVRAYGDRIARNAPLTIAAAKSAIDAAVAPPDAGRRAAVDRAVAACFASEDYREGRLAFREKRAPRFQGR